MLQVIKVDQCYVPLSLRTSYIKKMSLSFLFVSWITLDRHKSSQDSARTGWAKLNGANVVSFVVVKHVLENYDNFGRWNNSSFTHFEKHKN